MGRLALLAKNDVQIAVNSDLIDSLPVEQKKAITEFQQGIALLSGQIQKKTKVAKQLKDKIKESELQKELKKVSGDIKKMELKLHEMTHGYNAIFDFFLAPHIQGDAVKITERKPHQLSEAANG